MVDLEYLEKCRIVEGDRVRLTVEIPKLGKISPIVIYSELSTCYDLFRGEVVSDLRNEGFPFHIRLKDIIEIEKIQ